MKRLDAATLPAVLDRIARLQPDSPRQFGTLTPPRMLGHMRQSVATSLSRQPVTTPATLAMKLMRPILWPIVISGLPWPKGRVKTPPEFETPDAADLATEREQLQALLADFIAAAQENPRARPVTHPAFGRLSMRQWARLHLLHFDHHLRQFGV